MARPKDIKPGTPEAFRYGCSGASAGCVGEHVKGCVLWDGTKVINPTFIVNAAPAPFLFGSFKTQGGMAPVPAASPTMGSSKIPLGATWTKVKQGTLFIGEVYISDGDHQFFIARGYMQSNGFISNGCGSYAIMKMELNGPSTDQTEVWRMDLVY